MRSIANLLKQEHPADSVCTVTFPYQASGFARTDLRDWVAGARSLGLDVIHSQDPGGWLTKTGVITVKGTWLQVKVALSVFRQIEG